MAFRNSVKATLFLEPEQPRSRAAEPGPLFDATTTITEPAPVIQPAPVIESVPVAPRPVSREALLAATWHARAEALVALADTLPSKGSSLLISKIASLYEVLARDAGWCEETEAPAQMELRLEAPPAADESQGEDEPPAEEESPAAPSPEQYRAFPRRPLPSARAVPRRRA
jgi:hypothetical protein